MSRRLCPSLILKFFLILVLLLSTAIAPIPGGYHGQDPEDPHEILNVPAERPDTDGEGSTGSTYSPFSTPDSEEEEGPDPEELEDLADKIKELIDDIIDALPQNSTSSSTPPSLTYPVAQTTTFPSAPISAAATTSPNSQVNETLACEIYQAYTSLCPAPPSTPYTSTLPSIGGGKGGNTIIVDASSASQDSARSRASCLCYSNAYFVPQVYDDAALFCAGYTGDPTTTDALLAAAATSAAQTVKFCSSIGTAIGATAALFGQFGAATTTPPQSAAPSRSTGIAGKLAGAERGTWECLVVVVVIAAFV